MIGAMMMTKGKPRLFISFLVFFNISPRKKGIVNYLYVNEGGMMTTLDGDRRQG